MKQASKPRSPQHLVFELERWNELRKLFAEDARQYDLVAEKDIDDAARRKKTIAKCKAALLRFLEQDALLCTVKRIAPASDATRGAKKVWSDDMVIYAWLAIETKRLRARAADLKPFLEKLFAGLSRRRRRLIVHINAGTAERVEIESAGHARRLYGRAQKLMAADPRLAARWRDLAQHHGRRARN